MASLKVLKFFWKSCNLVLNSTFIVSMLSDNSLAKVSMFSCIVLVPRASP